MLSDGEFGDVVVTVGHPWGDVEVPLEEWVERGPGSRPYVGLSAARRISTGQPVGLSQIPQMYHNSPQSRELQRQGLLPCPWGPPPKPEPDGAPEE